MLECKKYQWKAQTFNWYWNGSAFHWYFYIKTLKQDKRFTRHYMNAQFLNLDTFFRVEAKLIFNPLITLNQVLKDSFKR